MADKQDKTGLPDFNMNAMNTGMYGFAIPMPIPVFTPQVMPIRMIPPFWPMNSSSFMQQYMEAMSSGMMQAINQSSVNQKEPLGKTTSKGDVSSQSLGKPAIPTALENTSNGNTNQFLPDFGKRPGVNLPQFPNPMLFPFGGFVPFGSYFPGFSSQVSGSADKQNKDSDVQVTEQSHIKEMESNNSVDEIMEVNIKQQSTCDGGINQEESLQRKPVFKPSEIKLQEQEASAKDSHSHEVSDNNSPEMDVAQILVNFMPVPVIGSVKQDAKDCPEKVPPASTDKESSKKENVVVFPAANTTVVSTASRTSVITSKNVVPEDATSVKNVSPNSDVAVQDMTTMGTSASMDSIPKQHGESSKAQQIMNKEEMPVHKDGNNHITNCNVEIIEHSSLKPATQISNAAPTGTVILLVNPQASSQPQGNHSSVITYVKSEMQHDVQMHNESAENGTNLMEIVPLAEECQQEIVSDEENAIPTVDDLLKGDLGNDKSTYKCEVCAQLFRSSLGLQKHLEFHMDDGQHYTCTICFQPFKEAKTLEDHIAQHMRKRPHKCKFCPKAFRDPGSLQKHVRVHTGEKPYKCTSCYQSFAEYSSLRKHLRVHTGEQPYRCQYCDKAFSISGNLQRHVLIHTGERPYKCSFCPKAFNNPSHLRRHVKNLHFKGEATTGVVEDMISALHGEVSIHAKKSLTANEVEIETTEQNIEISQEEEEEEEKAFTPKIGFSNILKNWTLLRKRQFLGNKLLLKL